MGGFQKRLHDRRLMKKNLIPSVVYLINQQIAEEVQFLAESRNRREVGAQIQITIYRRQSQITEKPGTQNTNKPNR